MWWLVVEANVFDAVQVEAQVAGVALAVACFDEFLDAAAAKHVQAREHAVLELKTADLKPNRAHTGHVRIIVIIATYR